MPVTGNVELDLGQALALRSGLDELIDTLRMEQDNPAFLDNA